jgi:hypothetical protein
LRQEIKTLNANYHYRKSKPSRFIGRVLVYVLLIRAYIFQGILASPTAFYPHIAMTAGRPIAGYIVTVATRYCPITLNVFIVTMARTPVTIYPYVTG